MRQNADTDYGPYHAAAGDPRTPIDDRDFDMLDDAEKRSRLAELSHSELIELVIRLHEDAEMWEFKARRIAALGHDATSETRKAILTMPVHI